MWRHEDFWRVLGGGIDFYTGVPLEEYDQSKQATEPRMMTFPLSPLMHGGAQAGLLMHLFAGHLTVLEPKFDAERTWEVIEREKVQLMFMTGDAMALPLIDEYERGDRRRDAVRRLQPLRHLQQRGDLQPAGQEALDGRPSPTGSSPTRSARRRPASTAWACRTRTRSAPTDRSSASAPAAWWSTTTTGSWTRSPTSARSGGSPGAATSRSATTRTQRSPPRPSSRSTASATRSRATTPGSRRTTRSPCSAAAPTASTPVARRSTPRRWRWRSRTTRPSTTASWSASPTRSSARPSPPSSRVREGTSLELEELREFLRAHLSGYKLPRALTVVDEVPAQRDRQGAVPQGQGDGSCARHCVRSSGSSTRSSRSPRPSTSRPRSRGPAGWACWAASGSTTPRSSSGS